LGRARLLTSPGSRPGISTEKRPALDMVYVGCCGQVPAFSLRRFGLVGQAVFDAKAIIAGLEDMTMMSEPVEECGGHVGIPVDASPFAEGQVGGASCVRGNGACQSWPQPFNVTVPLSVIFQPHELYTL